MKTVGGRVVAEMGFLFLLIPMYLLVATSDDRANQETVCLMLFGFHFDFLHLACSKDFSFILPKQTVLSMQKYK